MHEEKTVSYTSQNTYYTLNKLTEKTTKIWLVCHGIGYLSPYFLEHFKKLDPERNYIIAPQAPSKYYQDKRYKYIGASWFTRLNTEMETHNVVRYLDEVYNNEIKERNNKIEFIAMGYSQGVSAITRWLANSKISCDHLIIHSGSVPEEFNESSFAKMDSTKITLLYGIDDPYISEKKIENQLSYLQSVFKKEINLIPFNGVHEVHEESLIALSE